MSKQTSSSHDLWKANSGKKDEKAPSFLIPLFKLPIFLYQIRLGWLLGKRFMQITHVGRRSGKIYKTVLAVLRFDEKTKEIYAVSAWKGSDWYYNILSSPALQVEIGFVRYVPVQRTLSPEEIATTFVEYCKNNLLFSRIICRIPGWKWDSTYEEFLGLARTLRGWHFQRRELRVAGNPLIDKQRIEIRTGRFQRREQGPRGGGKRLDSPLKITIMMIGNPI